MFLKLTAAHITYICVINHVLQEENKNHTYSLLMRTILLSLVMTDKQTPSVSQVSLLVFPGRSQSRQSRHSNPAKVYKIHINLIKS